MFCPFCNAADTRVLDSRLVVKGKQIKRRRQCVVCGARFTTYEVAALTYPWVMKRDGTRQAFEEQKLRCGIRQALQKKVFEEEAVEGLVQDILYRIRTLGGKEISSVVIGNIVMEVLKEFDQVAYVRFASVYRNFGDVESFKKEIQQLKQHKK